MKNDKMIIKQKYIVIEHLFYNGYYSVMIVYLLGNLIAKILQWLSNKTYQVVLAPYISQK